MNLLTNEETWSLQERDYDEAREELANLPKAILKDIAKASYVPLILEALCVLSPLDETFQVHQALINNPCVPMHILEYLTDVNNDFLAEQAKKKISYLNSF